MDRLRVPGLSYEDVRGHAEEFLSRHHPSRTIPIPIEEIVEFSLGVNIIPIPDLLAVHDVDGFISADLSELSVDQFILERRPARYRFTLAHEVGHIVLHGSLLKEVRLRSVDDWKRFVREMPETERASLEWQAYAFGGLVLAPKGPLQELLRSAMAAAEAVGFDVVARFDIAREYIATQIGNDFGVSSAVIDRRLVADGNWRRAAGA